MPARLRHLWPEIAAIVRQESGFRPWALRDETAGREVRVRDAGEAVAHVRANPGHVFGAGLGQITGGNLPRWFGPEWWRVAFQPCAGLRATVHHFVTDNLPVARARYNGSGDATKAYAVSVAGHLERITGAAPQSPALPLVVASSACGGPPPAWASWQRARWRACTRGEVER